MLNSNFVILGAVFNLLGSTGYVRDTLKGKTQPNRVTWFLWALAPLLAFSAELGKHVGLQSLMTFMAGFGPLMVLLASFVDHKAYWKITRLDWSCGALALATLVLWKLTRDANVAIILSIATDGLAGVPTIIKSYKQPKSESYIAFLGGAASAALTLLTVKHWTLANYGFPAYILIICITLVALITIPRRRAAIIAS